MKTEAIHEAKNNGQQEFSIKNGDIYFTGIYREPISRSIIPFVIDEYIISGDKNCFTLSKQLTTDEIVELLKMPEILTECQNEAKIEYTEILEERKSRFGLINFENTNGKIEMTMIIEDSHSVNTITKALELGFTVYGNANKYMLSKTLNNEEILYLLTHPKYLY